MRIICTAILLGLSFCSTGQNIFKKNEISIGYTLGYYFDSTEITHFRNPISSNYRIQNISVAYTRYLRPNLAVKASYSHMSYIYLRKIELYRPGIFPDNFILSRNINLASIAIQGSKKLARFQIATNLGINYMRGYKFNHYIFYGFGLWKEPVREGINFGRVGASGGVSIQHPIWKLIFGALSVDYLRLFKETDDSNYGLLIKKTADPNQLYLKYSIGVQF